MSYFGDPRIERVPLACRKDRLHLKGVKTTASIEPDAFGSRYPPDEWRMALHAAMPVLARTQAAWSNEKHRHERAVHGYTGYWVSPWKTLRIHCCAECESARYVAHYAVRRCEACERGHRQDRARSSNAVMIARRAEQRAAARTEMTCEQCDEPMTGERLKRYCSAACRQAAYRERQQA